MLATVVKIFLTMLKMLEISILISIFRCFPRLNEGDQLVLINGRDVADHSHDQVVNFIRACSEPHSGQIELAVKQVLT